MSKVNITQTDKEIINNILKNNLPIDAQVFAFGSRVRFNNTKFSDFDLALKMNNNQKVPLKIFAQLKNEFEESDLIYKVDLIDLNNISDSFLNSIKDDLVKFI